MCFVSLESMCLCVGVFVCLRLGLLCVWSPMESGFVEGFQVLGSALIVWVIIFIMFVVLVGSPPSLLDARGNGAAWP